MTYLDGLAVISPFIRELEVKTMGEEQDDAGYIAEVEEEYRKIEGAISESIPQVVEEEEGALADCDAFLFTDSELKNGDKVIGNKTWKVASPAGENLLSGIHVYELKLS